MQKIFVCTFEEIPFELKSNGDSDTKEEELEIESVHTFNLKPVSWTLVYIYCTKFSFSEKERSQWNTTQSGQLFLIITSENVYTLRFFEQTRFPLSVFRKWYFFIEKLFHWGIPQKFITWNLWKLWRRHTERP